VPVFRSKLIEFKLQHAIWRVSLNVRRSGPVVNAIRLNFAPRANDTDWACDGIAPKNSFSASTPPADAPKPTMWFTIVNSVVEQSGRPAQ